MKPIKSFLAKIRQIFLNWRVNREIFQRIPSHLRKEANRGYPFETNDELVERQIHSGLDAHVKFTAIERMAADMPQYYSDAFRYIVYRDLNERIRMYLEIAADRVEPQTRKHRLVERPA